MYIIESIWDYLGLLNQPMLLLRLWEGDNMEHIIALSVLLGVYIIGNKYVTYVREEDYINNKLRTLALLKQKGRARHVLPKN